MKKIIKEIRHRRMEGFVNIYEDEKSRKLRIYLSKLIDEISNLFSNKRVAFNHSILTLHKLIYVIEKRDVSKSELETIVYSLSYHFLKSYIDVSKLVEISGMSIDELRKKGERSIRLMQDSYEEIRDSKINMEKRIKEKINSFEKLIKNEQKRGNYDEEK